jgi:4a-hydroxytetrahydrobiopterin dehydratase
MPPLSKPQILPTNFDYAKALPHWQMNSRTQELVREFSFQDFKHAFQFMTLCARLADELDHHPDWSNSWNKVSVRLSTHSLKAITELDITMAKAMDQFALQVLA